MPVSRKTGGPIPKYNDYHVWKTMMILNREIPVGRKKLSEMIGIGEGSTRSILGLLQDNDYITTDRSGILLTDEGEEFRETIYLETEPIVASDLTINACDCAVRIPMASKRISFGCEERDIAIKSGATGATTLVCKNGTLLFPGSDYPVSDTVEISLRDKFSIKNGDVIIIGTANNLQNAECGAVSAALNVIGGIGITRDSDEFPNAGVATELLSLAFAVHDLFGGLPVCAKSKNNLGVRIEGGIVIDNAYTGDVLEEALRTGTTIRKIAETGPYKGTKVIVTPIEVKGHAVAAIGVVDIRRMAEDFGLHPIKD